VNPMHEKLVLELHRPYVALFLKLSREKLKQGNIRNDVPTHELMFAMIFN
jgi:hypothetical protein